MEKQEKACAHTPVKSANIFNRIRLLVSFLAIALTASYGSNSHAANASSSCGDVIERPWCDTTLSATLRTGLLLNALTLDEKLRLMAGDNVIGAITGNPAVGVSNGLARVGINTVYYSDGPLGVREGKATAHTSPLAVASSFNRNLAREVGQAIGNEVRHKGNDVVHAPTLDVVRIYTSGRVFETFGEDPYLVSQMGLEWMQGVESEGIIANAKHFGVYTQEGLLGIPLISGIIGSRFLYNAVIDERAMREIYLSPFEVLVRQGGLDSVMCSYNYVNGFPACSSKHLLTDILRDEWGFKGYVITDYVFGQKGTFGAVNAGTDLEMPIGLWYSPSRLKQQLNDGRISEQTIDQRVGGILYAMFEHGLVDRSNYPANEAAIDKDAHGATALKSAEQGIVLLKNDNLLPIDLAKTKSIAIIGEASNRFISGGGSSVVNPYDLRTPRDAISERATAAGLTISYHAGNNIPAAANVAATADIALVFVTTSSTEGDDRTCLALACLKEKIAGRNPDRLITAVAEANPNTIVILQTNSVVLTPWRQNIGALLQAWFPGQYGGIALSKILFGDINPSGKLPLTFPESAKDTLYANRVARYPGLPEFGPNGSVMRVEYDEGVMVGYRWFDDQAKNIAYPFGFGLSYTQFSYSDLAVSGTFPNLTITATITNTGERAGDEVAQLYVGLPDASASERQPPWQLKGFERVTLNPGQSKTVEFALEAHLLSYWSEATNQWALAPGCYELAVGPHSRSQPLKASVALGGGQCQ